LSDAGDQSLRRGQVSRPHLQPISLDARFASAVVAAGGGDFRHPARLGGFTKADPGDPHEFQRKHMTMRKTTIHWTRPGRFEAVSR